MSLYCAICAGILRTPTAGGGRPWAPELRWQARVVLVHDPAREFETLEEHYHAGKRKDAPRLDFRLVPGADQDIRMTRAICSDRGDGYHFLLERVAATPDDGDDGPSRGSEFAGPGVRANSHQGRDRHGAWEPTPYYVATHEACVGIAVRVAARPRAGVRVRSLRAHWKVLRMRFDACDNEVMAGGDPAGSSTAGYVPIRHGYYLPGRTAARWPIGHGASYEHWCMADPECPADLTDMILENLEAFPSEESLPPDIMAFRARLLALPQELQDHITSFLRTAAPLPRRCTRLLPQEHWRQMLVYGRTVPFLWDIDVAAVDRCCAGPWPLDWERLVRELSQPTSRHRVFEDGIWTEVVADCYSRLKVPDGLRNRRRIWQIVEEMFVGDVLPSATINVWRPPPPPPTMPRYWDEDGEPVYPIIRVLGTVS